LAAGNVTGSDGILRLAGCRYWSASLLPALMGTTLPFWLRPPHFSFAWTRAFEFLIAAILFHAGFSFFQARVEGKSAPGWSGSRLLGAGGISIVTACVLGLHLNSGLVLHAGVPASIFIVYGLCTIFAGILYVMPPFNFCRRVGGEVVLAAGLGLLPVLGAYIVQVGDVTRSWVSLQAGVPTRKPAGTPR
jgi:1,4-dihydroxy-2-naphthoate octaprenyltransferase